MGIAVLGPLSVDDGVVRLGSRDRVVLAALAMRPGEVLSADQLADAVWREDPPASWNKNLQSCVVRLRKALGQEAIQTSPQGYRLVVPADSVDAQQFERLVARGRELLTLGEPELAAYTLGESLALWRGRPLVELEEWGPGGIEARRLEELRLEAKELRLEAALQAGHHREVLAEAQALVSAAPLRERRWELLARAQYQSGRQADALRTLHQLRRMLVQELGLDPGPGLEALEQAMLRQDPSLLVEAALPEAGGSCPYRGLTPYDVDDAEGFFGRDRDVDACLERLGRDGVLAVVGPSGSGKSSLVRAGVAAALQRAGRQVVVIAPGAHPLDALTALHPGKDLPVLVVDQCEEVFSLCEDTAERESFLAALVAHAKAAPVVIAMRADRLGDLSAHPAFARLVERGLFLLGAMAEEDLRAAIEGPARQVGLVVEPGLVDLLIREVEGEPGALPLMSHALRETWLRREGRTLTVSGYQAAGGIRGAVAQSAEEVYARVSPDQRHLLRDLLLRLVTPGLEGEPVRSRVPRRQVVSDPAQDRLIDLLVGARLVTSDDGVVELAHEALARAWPRLGAWLDDDIEGQRILHHLTSAADAWDTLGRPDSELYRGVRLAQTLDWQARKETALTKTEVAFLDAAQRLAETEQRSAQQRARQQARMIRRLRGVLAGAAVLLVAALIAGGLAVRQKGVADDNAAAALAAETSAEARRAGAKALVTDDIDLSMLLAVAGVRLDDSPQTRTSLLGVLEQHPELMASTQMTGESVQRFDVSPDGRTVATYDAANRVRLYSISSGELMGEFRAGAATHLAWVSGDVAFSPDGHAVAVMMAAPTREPVVLLDASNLEPLPAQPGGLERMRWQTQDLAYSGDGRFLAATVRRVVGTGATTRQTSLWAVVWNLGAPMRSAVSIRLKDLETSGVALSLDGSVLYTNEPELMIRDLAADRTVPADYREGLEPTISISRDGRLLAAVASEDGSVVLLDAATGRLQRRLPSSSGEDGWMVRFSADGSMLATVATFSAVALVWDVATGELLARLPLQEDDEPLSFGPDDSTLYTAGSEHSLRQWDIGGRRRFLSQIGYVQPGGPTGARVAPGGGFVAYQSAETVAFYDVTSKTLGSTLNRPPGSDTRNGSWHPDGVHYALATGSTVQVWDARTRSVVVERQPSGAQISQVDFSTDGSRLAVAESSRVLMLDPGALQPLGQPVRLDGVACGLSLGPDNRTALVLTGGPERLWDFWRAECRGWSLVDLESGTVVAEGVFPLAAGGVEFAPDGRHAAISGGDGLVFVLSLETGEPVRPPVIGHAVGVTSLMYSSDGKRILSSGFDGAVGMWDAETGQLVARVVTPQRPSVAGFGADGHSVVVAPGYFDGSVYRWDTRGDYAVDYACRMAGRDMTRAEWAEQFGAREYQHVCPS